MSERILVRTDDAPAAVGPYSQAVKVGTTLYTSGQIPLTLEGTLVDGDVETQARQVLANLTAVLRAGGSDPSRVVKCTVYLADIGDFARVNAVYAETFPDAPPARSAFQVGALPFGAAVEIEAIAVCDPG